MKLKLLLIIPLLFSCSQQIKVCDYKENLIKESDLFEYKNKYYVFVYLDKCMACRDTKLKLMNYCEFISEKIYYLDFLETNFFNNPKSDSNILKTNYHDIYLKTVPHLFLIDNKTIVNEWSSFNDISEYLNKLSLEN